MPQSVRLPVSSNQQGQPLVLGGQQGLQAPPSLQPTDAQPTGPPLTPASTPCDSAGGSASIRSRFPCASTQKDSESSIKVETSPLVSTSPSANLAKTDSIEICYSGDVISSCSSGCNRNIDCESEISEEERFTSSFSSEYNQDSGIESATSEDKGNFEENIIENYSSDFGDTDVTTCPNLARNPDLAGAPDLAVSQDHAGAPDLACIPDLARDLNDNTTNEFEMAKPIIDWPISREGLTLDDFVAPTSIEVAAAQQEDEVLRQVREWVKAAKCPTAEDVAPLSGFLKSFAQLVNELSLRENVLILKQSDDSERGLIIVPTSLTEHINVFGPEGYHQAITVISANLNRTLWCPLLKRDGAIYIACGPVCEEFLHHGRRPRSRLKYMDLGSLYDCNAMDFVGGKDSLPISPHIHRMYSMLFHLSMLINTVLSYSLHYSVYLAYSPAIALS